MNLQVWLCHGVQLDAPCSRVGHLYRPRPFLSSINTTYDYAHRYVLMIYKKTKLVDQKIQK